MQRRYVVKTLTKTVRVLEFCVEVTYEFIGIYRKIRVGSL